MDDTRKRKRKFSAPHTKQAAQKRQKVKAGKHAATQARTRAGGHVVAADSLPWTAVAVPEMFNDAEGFFGLEEVTGVEVVRDGDNVRFVSA